LIITVNAYGGHWFRPQWYILQKLEQRGSEWKMFLRTGDRDVAIRYEYFLRGLKEFEGVSTRACVRSLENEIFLVSPLVASCYSLNM